MMTALPEKIDVERALALVESGTHEGALYNLKWKNDLIFDTCKAIDAYEGHNANAFRHRIMTPVYRMLMTKAKQLSGYVRFSEPLPKTYTRADLPEFLSQIINDLLGGGLSEQEIRQLLLQGL